MNFTKTFTLLFLIFLLGFLPRSAAQIIYFNNTLGQIYSFNVATCTATQISPDFVAFNDMAVANNGIIYGLVGQTIFKLDTNTGIVTEFGTYNNIISASLEYANGFLYFATIQGGLWQVSTTTGVSQLLGNLPAGWNSIGDLVVFNGEFYGTFNTPGGPILANVNIGNPAASTVVNTLPGSDLIGGAAINNATCPKMYWFGSDDFIWEYDVNAQTWTQICAGFPFFVGGADTPNDYVFQISCGCTTNAGNVTAQIFNLCGTAATVTVPFTGGQVLDADDILRYVLFENLTDPEGSILVQSSTPTFNFNANLMEIGQTYYLGTIAGNNQNGSVNLTDPCLDLSNNFAQVTWRGLPTVVFSAAQNVICTGNCQNIAVNFTGTPPFNLTYESSAGGGAQTQTFVSNSGVFQFCPPVGFLGGLTVQAASLTDANCACD